MKIKFKHILIIILGVFLSSPFSALAADIAVTFTPDPLFTDTEYLPGDTTTGRQVEVTNLSGTTQEIYFGIYNFTDSGSLSDNISIQIEEDFDLLWRGTVAEIYSGGGHYLSEILPGETTIYDISSDFLKDSGNGMQGKELSFDLWFGFDQFDPPIEPLGGSSGSFSGSGGSAGIGILQPEITGEVLGAFTDNLSNIPGSLGQPVKKFVGYLQGVVKGTNTQNASSIYTDPIPVSLEQNKQLEESVLIILSQESCMLPNLWWLLLVAALLITYLWDRLLYKSHTGRKYQSWHMRLSMFVSWAIAGLGILYISGSICLLLVKILIGLLFIRVLLHFVRKI